MKERYVILRGIHRPNIENTKVIKCPVCGCSQWEAIGSSGYFYCSQCDKNVRLETHETSRLSFITIAGAEDSYSLNRGRVGGVACPVCGGKKWRDPKEWEGEQGQDAVCKECGKTRVCWYMKGCAAHFTIEMEE